MRSTHRATAKGSGCGTGRFVKAIPSTLDAIVRRYQKNNLPDLQADLDYYRSLKTFQEVVESASKARRSDGSFHQHQYRVGKVAMVRIKQPLLRMEPASYGDFSELYTALEQMIGDFPRIGALAVYDTALRLGAFLMMMPESVYLQTGAKVGAKSLGLRCSNKTLAVQDCPVELHRLKPWEIEDFLCIYKKYFERIREQMHKGANHNA